MEASMRNECGSIFVFWRRITDNEQRCGQQIEVYAYNEAQALELVRKSLRNRRARLPAPMAAYEESPDFSVYEVPLQQPGIVTSFITAQSTVGAAAHE
jgi:hypothetical protein